MRCVCGVLHRGCWGQPNQLRRGFLLPWRRRCRRERLDWQQHGCCHDRHCALPVGLNVCGWRFVHLELHASFWLLHRWRGAQYAGDVPCWLLLRRRSSIGYGRRCCELFSRTGVTSELNLVGGLHCLRRWQVQQRGHGMHFVSRRIE